ncbi:MAG: hypothetical protein JNK38_00285 [Acidobacteria bacterium]|nr:hypothetical protein [Acidobacteriota bacterium]
MTYQLDFDSIHQYDPGRPDIAIPVSLKLSTGMLTTEAHLDTGSANCFFRRSLGERLGLDIESGYLQGFSTPGGVVEGYGHPVTLEAVGMEFDTIIYFAKDRSFNRNLLGRHGWLQRVRMGLVDYDGVLYLSRYESEQR